MALHLHRPPSPDLPPMAYHSRPSSAMPDDSTQRKPYHYGGLALGSVHSHGSSRPSSPRVRSSLYSQGEPATPPPSQRNRSSTGLSFTHSGAPTPPLFASTAIAPGPSQPPSRPSTPGPFHASAGAGGAPPSAFARQSWPRYADDEPDGPAFGGVVRERRPSRLSLTLSTWEGTRESGEHGEGPSRRSTSASLRAGGADVARSASVSTDVHHVLEPSRSTLFVVNSEDHKNMEETRPVQPG
jgi:hypothetical protein